MPNIPLIITIFDENGYPKLDFKDSDGLQEFAERHRWAYQWLSNVRNDPTYSKYVDWISSGLDELLRKTMSQDGNLNYEEDLTTDLEALFGKGRLPIIGSANMVYLEHLTNNYSYRSAIGALSYYTNKPFQAADSDCFRGMILAANNDAVANVDIQKIAIELRREHKILSDTLDTDIEKLRQVKAAYEESLPLKAPVDYWRSKSKKHKLASDSYRDLITKQGWKYGAGLLGILALVIFFTHLTTDSTASIGAYIGPATLGVLLTSVGLWAARICVRLYMSEHHLYIDAEERAVMIQTYLSLIQEGALSKEDRALVLAPIFRSSTDGIVKDDAAPDATLAAIISKALAK